MLACGHGPLSYPPVLAKARQDPALADRIVQAYAPKQYDPTGRYIVIGSGIASVNEWANAIDVGAGCISLVRNPTPDEQDSEHPAPLRGARDRCLPGTRLRPADGVPRADPQGHCAASPRLGREDRDRSERGSLRADHRRDRQGRAGAARSARSHHEQARRRPGLARRDRRRHGHRVQQVGAFSRSCGG